MQTSTVLIVYDALINSKIDRENFYMTICRVNDAITNEYSVDIELLIPERVLLIMVEEYGELSADIISSFKEETGNQTFLQYASDITSYCVRTKPQFIFFPSSILGRGLSAWLGAKLKAGVVADVVDLEYLNDCQSFKYVRATAESELLASIKCIKKPEIASVRGKKSQESLMRKPVFKNVCFDRSGIEPKIEVMKRHLYDAPGGSNNVVIGIGRGVTSTDMHLIRNFADEHNIPVMGSKPMVESKFLDKDKQIGQSGNFIHADIYIAVGISGAPQHIVGILDCKKIIAINPDRNAPIHNYSDVTLLMSAHEVFSSL